MTEIRLDRDSVEVEVWILITIVDITGCSCRDHSARRGIEGAARGGGMVSVVFRQSQR